MTDVIVYLFLGFVGLLTFWVAHSSPQRVSNRRRRLRAKQSPNLTANQTISDEWLSLVKDLCAHIEEQNEYAKRLQRRILELDCKLKKGEDC